MFFWNSILNFQLQSLLSNQLHMRLKILHHVLISCVALVAVTVVILSNKPEIDAPTTIESHT